MSSAIPREIILNSEGKRLSFEHTGKNYSKLPQGVPTRGTHDVKEDYSVNPYHQVGKVFFSEGTNNYVCSGSAVGGNVVLTAGHCVADSGNWFTNWLFIPNFKHDNEPYGAFPATNIITFNTWFYNSDMGRDVAFAIVGSPELKASGQSLQDIVGALGFVTDVSSKTAYWDAIGYPAASPFTGKIMVQTYEPQSITDKNPTPNTRGIISKMTGGCSGGPWVYAVNVGSQNSNTVNAAGGLNSYGYNGRPHLYSPTFDQSVKDLYEQAINSPSA
jgi:V8-like Glu-specific endopeptidase